MIDKKWLKELIDIHLSRIAAAEISEGDICGWGNVCQSASDALRELLVENAALQARVQELEAKVPKWVQVSERLPEPNTPVLVAVPSSRIVLRAVWIPKHWADEEELCVEFLGEPDWSEDGTRSYWPEGWYEWNCFEETHWRTESEPTHWMPLLETPRHD